MSASFGDSMIWNHVESESVTYFSPSEDEVSLTPDFHSHISLAVGEIFVHDKRFDAVCCPSNDTAKYDNFTY